MRWFSFVLLLMTGLLIILSDNFGRHPLVLQAVLARSSAEQTLTAAPTSTSIPLPRRVLAQATAHLYLPLVSNGNKTSVTATATPTSTPLIAPTATATATTPAGALRPALFFTDLESGPSTGGQDNLGAFITLYGEGFGATRGNSTVTIGGQEVARYVVWGENNGVARNLDMLVVQPGANVVSGNIVVTVNGESSNALPFTVRSGQIYFVIADAPNADDGNPGSYLAPFKTIYRPRQVLQAGDIIYIKGGTFATSDPEHPGWDAVLFIYPETDANGTVERPIAYLGYPGDPPVIGALPPMRRGILVDGSMTNYVFANLEFTHYAGMLELSGNRHRVIGNYFHDGIHAYGGVIGIAGDSTDYAIWGNFIRNNGEIGEKQNGHGLYLQGFGSNADIDFGWNQIQDQRGGRAIQLFGHDNGDRIENVRIHDNLLIGSELNNLTIGGSDGNSEVIGTIHIYNNIIVDAGDPGLRINDPQGTFVIQNNTLYNNGSPGFDGNAQIYIQRASKGAITLQNNIVYAESTQNYFLFEAGLDATVFASANRNLVYNAGACPTWDTGCINADPLFVGIESLDFRIQAQSPAINMGVNTNIARDFAGIPRPQGGAIDIGAHEYVTTTVDALR